MEKIKIGVCDDDRGYLEIIKEYLNNIKTFSFEYDLFDSGEELLESYTSQCKYDVIFLDMEMSGIDGIETANRIRKKDSSVIIVFITFHTKYMQKSFECSPFRFLIKPVEFEEFKIVMEKIKIKIQKDRSTFVFTVNRNRIRLFCDDIIYFESEDHFISIHTKERKYKIRKSISEIVDLLRNDDMFSQTHKSFIINLKYISEIRESEIILYYVDKAIPVSRSYKRNFVDKYINYKERKYIL